MSKKVYFLRHAKSDWSDSGQKDFDRALNGRGQTDAPKMGITLREKGIHPDLIISSPAVRAKNTAEYIAEQLRYDTDQIFFEPDIYESSARTLLSIVNNLEEKYSNVMIVGHNPGLTHIVEYLTKEPIGNIPTSGVALVSFEIGSWKEVTEGVGKLDFFLYPKNTFAEN
jgi:phosphohistidine phosphatase